MTPAQGSSCKVAFIGSHGVGKTTLCYGLAARLKAKDLPVDVVQEVARRCPLPVNEETSVAAQNWILHTQIAEEILAQARHPVVVCDRSVLDNYVYLLVAGYELPEHERFLAYWMSTYDLLVHVPIVEEPVADGFRSTDPAFQRLVDERLESELDKRHLEVARLDDLDREDWVAAVEGRVWQRLEPAQLRLI